MLVLASSAFSVLQSECDWGGQMVIIMVNIWENNKDVDDGNDDDDAVAIMVLIVLLSKMMIVFIMMLLVGKVLFFFVNLGHMRPHRLVVRKDNDEPKHFASFAKFRLGWVGIKHSLCTEMPSLNAPLQSHTTLHTSYLSQAPQAAPV